MFRGKLSREQTLFASLRKTLIDTHAANPGPYGVNLDTDYPFELPVFEYEQTDDDQPRYTFQDFKRDFKNPS